MTLQEFFQAQGERTICIGVSEGTETGRSDDGRPFTRFLMKIGVKQIKAKIRPESDFVAPPPGTPCQVTFDQGVYEGKPFYNNPRQPKVIDVTLAPAAKAA